MKTDKIWPMQTDRKLWDQQESLRPPPFSGPLRRLLNGLNKGDPLIDSLPTSKLCCHGSKVDDIQQLPEPYWVDWQKVERGQKMWQQHLSQSFLALGAALIQGFTISRFAVVLHHNGYAQSPETAYERYRETSFAVMDWFRFPLNNPASIARRSVYSIRTMHGLARRKSGHLFDQEAGEGIALSQYDMAEVQLGFAAVSLNVMQHEMKIGNINRGEMDDMVHCWRLIGYHLGIEDEFNVCNSLEDMEACLAEYISWTKLKLMTLRQETHDLQRSAIQGFGKYTGLGVRFWEGLLQMLQRLRGIEYQYVKGTEAFLPGMEPVASSTFSLLGYDVVNKLMSKVLVSQREVFRSDPLLARKRLEWVRRGSVVNDTVSWPVYSKFYRFVMLLRRNLRISALVCALLAVYLVRAYRARRLSRN